MYKPYSDNGIILWEKKNGKWKIIYDCYGLGITDDWNVDRPIIYDDKRVAYDFPEGLPAYVKNAFSSLAKKEKIQNRMNIERG